MLKISSYNYFFIFYFRLFSEKTKTNDDEWQMYILFP